MKNRKKRNFFILWSLLGIFISIGVVFASTILTINQQTATATGSNNSSVTFSSTGSRLSQYVNSGDDSTIIGNHFEWYYYDSLYWFFQLNWSSNWNENVRIISTTSACVSWVWYKLGWKAYSQYAWYIDFNYSATDFVYYCESDGLLHGKAYSQSIWFQNFEGIGFQIATSITQSAETISHTWVFQNDDTSIDDVYETISDPTTRTSGEFIDSFEDSWESLFYIIK